MSERAPVSCNISAAVNAKTRQAPAKGWPQNSVAYAQRGVPRPAAIAPKLAAAVLAPSRKAIRNKHAQEKAVGSATENKLQTYDVSTNPRAEDGSLPTNVSTR